MTFPPVSFVVEGAWHEERGLSLLPLDGELLKVSDHNNTGF